MKSFLSKMSLSGLALLIVGGCNHKDLARMEQIGVRDTVVVLNYVHPSMQSGRKIWMADKNGNEFYSYNVSLGPKPAVAPKPGEEVVVKHGFNKYGSYYVMVLENLSAQRLKAQYVNDGICR